MKGPNFFQLVLDGNITLKLYCECPGCNFCTTSVDYMNKHVNDKHQVWKAEQNEMKKVVKTSEDGFYHCHAVPPCEEIHCKGADGIRKHYKVHHFQWWEENKSKRKKTE